MDGVHVAAQITLGDGGEDAQIEWRDGPRPNCVSFGLGFIPPLWHPEEVTEILTVSTVAVRPAGVESGDRAGWQELHPFGRVGMGERQAGAKRDGRYEGCGVKGNGVMIAARRMGRRQWRSAFPELPPKNVRGEM